MAILFKNISPTAFFLGSKTISKVLFKDNVVWKNGPDLSKPLTFTATGDSSVQLVKNGSPADISLEYSYDGFKTDPLPYTIGAEIELTNGQSISMRAVSTNDKINSSWSNYYQFVMTGSIAASGNIQSLLDKTCQRMDVPNNCYHYMFRNCSVLTKAPELPATTLASNCYEYMFESCKSLTQAPELPATTLANSCYYAMFNGCSALTQAPKLPAKTLTSYCYYQMFCFCSALTKAPELPATTLASNCYRGMFIGSGITEFTVDMTACTSVPSLPSSTLFTDSGVSNYTVLVPASLHAEWIQATNWSTIKDNIQAV